MSHNIPYAKSNPEKMMVLRHFADTPQDMMSLMSFIKLSMDDFKIICQFKGNDWVSYGSMKEYEYGANRKADDIPNGVENADEYWAILTEPQFNAQKINNPSTNLTYTLYKQMREQEQKEE
jgi:hypothetical protein